MENGKRKHRSADASESPPNLGQPIQPQSVKKAPPAEIPTDSGLSGGFQVCVTYIKNSVKKHIFLKITDKKETFGIDFLL